MRKFEYKAVPAPATGTKARGVKTTEDRFALSLSNLLNEMADEGWEYVRAETLPCSERRGLTGTQQTYQNVLIFRRLEAAPMPLERTTTRPLHPVEPVAAEPEDDPFLPDEPPRTDEVMQPPEAVQPRLTSRPPEGGTAPQVRATGD